jgi:hypothetical protein
MSLTSTFNARVNADFDEQYEMYKEGEHMKNANEYQIGGSHYKDMAVQPWDVMQSVMTHEEFVGFLKGNVIKYSMRQGKKEGTDDAAKAMHYLAKLREVQEL